MTILTVTRYHDISAGHRVVGHEGKCRSLHGHNYRIHFECIANVEITRVDAIGRVIDFGVIKSTLCAWLEEHWDHKFLIWDQDPLARALNPRRYIDGLRVEDFDDIMNSFVQVPFNPTAELMADFLLHEVAPRGLIGTGVVCQRVTIEETRKCSASARLHTA